MTNVFLEPSSCFFIFIFWLRKRHKNLKDIKNTQKSFDLHHISTIFLFFTQFDLIFIKENCAINSLWLFKISVKSTVKLYACSNINLTNSIQVDNSSSARANFCLNAWNKWLPMFIFMQFMESDCRQYCWRTKELGYVVRSCWSIAVPIWIDCDVSLDICAINAWDGVFTCHHGNHLCHYRETDL